MARQAGTRVAAENAKVELLLFGLDASTSLPSSISGLSLLTQGTTRVCIIWAGDAGHAPIAQLLRAGVNGVVSQNIEPRRFHAALSAIRAGLQVIDPELWPSDSDSNRSSLREELTDREQQVLAMMGEGLSNKEISSRLAISTHTVKFHISSILGKLGAASRTEAVSIGVRSGRLTI